MNLHPFEMVYDQFPTTYQFSEGNNIRITICFADDGNFDTPILDPAPTLNLLRNASYQTIVELPIVQNPKFALEICIHPTVIQD